MKMNTNTKLMAFVAFLGFATFGYSQSTGDVAKGGTAIKVIDNKGTIKYFQSNNGITQIVNSTTDKTTTTWQLGGTLTADTYIDASGKLFALDGIALETGLASTNAVPGEKTKPTIPATSIVGTGWTLLVRDEATGTTKKMQADNLITGILFEDVRTVNTDGTIVVPIPVAGLPLLNANTEAKLFVFRNGAKLRIGTDFEVVTLGEVQIKTGLPMYIGDVIEVQYLK